MMTKRRSAGGLVRGASETGRWARPPGLAMLALALFGLVQAGCQSGGCTGCGLGGFGSRITNGVQALGARVANGGSRIFNHKSGGCSTCGEGGGIEEGVIVDPGTTMVPGGMVVPAPATVVPAPALESAPTQLEPIESNATGAKPASPTGSTGAANRSSPGVKGSAYEASAPRGKSARGRTPDISRALHSSPETARATSDSDDMLDNIPPVDVPVEVTRKAISLTAPSPPADPAPAAAQAPSPAPAAAPSTPSNPPATPVAEPSRPAAPASAESTSAAEGSASDVALRQAPGIRRSASVAPTVAGGSVPSSSGLDWLQEKGYKTFVDLRPLSEVDPNFVESVNDHGMVYLSLPIVADRLEPSRLARFDDLISRSENRPLYFCDADGTRAGLVWYLHLRSVEGVDAQSATQRAEEVGMTEAQARVAEAYLSGPKARGKANPAPPPAAEPTELAEVKPAPSALPASTPAPSPPPTPVTPPAPEASPVAPMLPGEHRPQASSRPDLGRFSEPMAWKPVAALILAGVGVPLACWSKSALSEYRWSRRRKLASLPAAERKSLSAPAGSDA